MKTRTRQISRSRAFTLLELMLVMTIAMAILAGSWPKLSAFSRANVLKSSAGSILALLNTASQAAAVNAADTRVEFDKQSNLCRAEILTDSEFAELSHPAGMNVQLPDGIEVEIDYLDGEETDENARYINFNSGGFARAVRITLANTAGDEIYIYSPSLLENFSISGDYEQTKP